jgi:hypothetical protein
MAYASLIYQEVLSQTCSHMHGSIAEAWSCAQQKQAEWGVKGATVVGADMGQDGLPRHRDLSEDEQLELEALTNGGAA